MNEKYNIKINNNLNTQTQRKMPANIEVEQTLLGAILINSRLFEKVSQFLLPEHFFEEAHARIYSAMQKLNEKNLTISLITTKAMLANDAMFNETHGEKYLLGLTNVATVIVDIYNYGMIIHDLAVKRNIIAIGEEMVNNAYNGSIESSSADQIESIESKLFQLSTHGSSNKAFEHVGISTNDSIEIINRAMKNGKAVTGISTKFDDLDKKLLGFHGSDLVVLAGRPSMGKTAFALNLALNCCLTICEEAKKGESPAGSVGFFSLEMSSNQLTTRLLSMMAKINSDSLKGGTISEESYNNLKNASSTLANLPIYIDDTPAITISSVVTRARRLKKKHNLSILFIDYLQLIHTNKSYSDSSGRVLQLSEITQSLKAIAKELNIPVIALSQLSRSVEKRENKRPMLSDLRESGSIEQDSDIVMFIHRDEYYLMREEPIGQSPTVYAQWQNQLADCKDLAEIFIAKHRNGSVGNVKLSYNSEYSYFDNMRKHVEYENYE